MQPGKKKRKQRHPVRMFACGDKMQEDEACADQEQEPRGMTMRGHAPEAAVPQRGGPNRRHGDRDLTGEHGGCASPVESVAPQSRSGGAGSPPADKGRDTEDARRPTIEDALAAEPISQRAIAMQHRAMAMVEAFHDPLQLCRNRPGGRFSSAADRRDTGYFQPSMSAERHTRHAKLFLDEGGRIMSWPLLFARSTSAVIT
ncbi:hypothetical protein FQA39_LY19388 [Lamprigera yunnana]|nr:hypothetical protein FQA39_LY19388 [Lamprigera yunnana]